MDGERYMGVVLFMSLCAGKLGQLFEHLSFDTSFTFDYHDDRVCMTHSARGTLAMRASPSFPLEAVVQVA